MIEYMNVDKNHFTSYTDRETLEIIKMYQFLKWVKYLKK